MYLILIRLFSIIFYLKIFVASMYDSACTTTCNFPGMFCVQGRCKCDWRIRLFWTGARCLSCPNSWAMTEIACIGFYGTPMDWKTAESTCASIHGDLISLRDNSILPLIYQVTGGISQRKKRTPALANPTIAWTSGHAIYLTNLGLYQWIDKSVNQFDSRSLWWCRPSIPNLGFYHTHTEPTRIVTKNDSEKCILFRRGKSSPMLCLDDVFCGQRYPFVCEKSESTAQKYFGQTLLDTGNIHGTTNQDSKSTTSSYSSKNPNTDDEHLLGMLGKPGALKSDKTKMIIIILVIVLLVLAAVIAGVFFFKRHRRTTETQFHAGKKGPTSSNSRPSVISGTSVNDAYDEDEASSYQSSVGQNDLTVDNGIDLKNKRGGYSKQRFDESD